MYVYNIFIYICLCFQKKIRDNQKIPKIHKNPKRFVNFGVHPSQQTNPFPTRLGISFSVQLVELPGFEPVPHQVVDDFLRAAFF